MRQLIETGTQGRHAKTRCRTAVGRERTQPAGTRVGRVDRHYAQSRDTAFRNRPGGSALRGGSRTGLDRYTGDRAGGLQELRDPAAFGRRQQSEDIQLAAQPEPAYPAVPGQVDAAHCEWVIESTDSPVVRRKSIPGSLVGR